MNTNSQGSVNMHPNFPGGAIVRHRGYNIRGIVTYSSDTSVWVSWNDGTTSHFDGWQAENSLARVAS